MPSAVDRVCTHVCSSLSDTANSAVRSAHKLHEVVQVNDTRSEHTLSLTEDEAMGLLDIVMLSPTDLSPEQRAAAEKLSNYCREIFREATAANSVKSGANVRLPVRRLNKPA